MTAVLALIAVIAVMIALSAYMSFNLPPRWLP